MIFRPATPEDRVFVISSWLDSFRDSHSAGMIAMSDFYNAMWPQIEKVLDRPDCRTIIAADTQLLGFLAADTDTDPPLVFYCYVKSPYRRWRPGIARTLFETMGINPMQPFDFAYKTPIVNRLASKIPLARWQPMLARFPKGEGRRR